MSQWSAQLHEVLHFDLTQPGWRKPKQGCWTCRFRQPVTQTYSKWWHKHKTSQNESESPPTAFLPCNSKKPWSGRWLHRPSAGIWGISISKHQLQLKQNNTNNGRGTSRSRRTADVTRIHEYKIIPPSYDGDCATFEEWKYNFMAYVGLVDHPLPSLLTRSETATRPITNEQLMDGAATIQEGTKWINLATEPRYMINITKGPAARVDKQESIPTGLKHGDKLFPDSPSL